eukprot:CAMPEP_0185757932 /NCGR_PEP_ID=MMETSP1174-20130828/16448_1 /TAXON_ID=35687 /ORGANISM="Dictyocha speculum, Strain CCMP1381" /LENGTH=59 /DNA_ID=CAMNT_0028437543 /DNA_START=249 /DNA_END=428 /DNA_ORIENTATION=-
MARAIAAAAPRSAAAATAGGALRRSTRVFPVGVSGTSRVGRVLAPFPFSAKLAVVGSAR